MSKLSNSVSNFQVIGQFSPNKQRLSKTHTAKYKPSHAIPRSQKILQTFKWKNLYFCCIRSYTSIQIFLHKLQLHENPPHVFINRLKEERFSAFLIRDGILFRFFGPRTLKLFSPNFTWLTFATFKFRFCCLRTVIQMINVENVWHKTWI